MIRARSDGFERTWRALITTFAVACLVSVASFGNQQAHAASDSASSENREQQAVPDNENVSKFTAALERWREEIDRTEDIVSDDHASDEDLREAPDRLEALRRDIVLRMDQLRPELKEAQARLEELGPAPDESGPSESRETSLQRQKLGADVAALDGLMKQANVLLVRTDQLIGEANAKRRERFTESLFRPVPALFQTALPAAVKGTASQVESLLNAIGEWLRAALGKGPLLVILLVLVPLAGAVIARRFIRRIVARRVRLGRKTTAEPTPQRRGTIAILGALESALPVWMALAAFYLIATAAELADPGPLGLLAWACIAIGWSRLLFAVVSHSLTPDDPAARVIAIDDQSARSLARLLHAFIAVWLIDQFWGLAEAPVYTPDRQRVLHAFVIASLYIGLLAALLWQLKRGSLSQQAHNGWLKWMLSPCALLAAVLVIAILLGYTELARFLGSNAVTTAGLLWILYLLHLGAESISSVSVVSGRQIEGETPDEEADAPSLLTIRIIAGLLMDIVIVAVGVTILLVLWRFDWVEVKGWIQAVFFGFQFGEIRISLQTIFIALAVFALGLALTRFVQGWFVKRAFVGRKKDQGLQESIKLGLGYAGFVLAALAGLSYLGLDFSNLAIVAGALSVGIGFGLQSIFNNFVSGLILLVERPIKIGDWISVGGHEGMVKKISVRSTEIETIYRQSVIIPNANLITESVINWMHGNRTCRLDIPVGVSYDTDVRVLRKILLDVGADHGATLKTPAPIVHFAGFGDSSLDFELRVFLRDAGQRITVASDLRFAIWSALQDAGIVIPFPQRDVHIKDGEVKNEV